MRLYEALLIFPSNAAPEAIEKNLTAIDGAIQKFEGKVVNKVDSGKKPLGYTVKKFREGVFYLIDFQMPPVHISELKRFFQLLDGLLKFTIIVKPVLSKAAIEKKAKIAAKKAAKKTDETVTSA
ncbi:MAG: 30S ribosomal protein S6 [Candidatus Omnitrophica bacterium]|nr:30S ribosomal protein S6 [Candidatus Omnitrophota bacterium]